MWTPVSIHQLPLKIPQRLPLAPAPWAQAFSPASKFFFTFTLQQFLNAHQHSILLKLICLSHRVILCPSLPVEGVLRTQDFGARSRKVLGKLGWYVTLFKVTLGWANFELFCLPSHTPLAWNTTSFCLPTRNLFICQDPSQILAPGWIFQVLSCFQPFLFLWNLVAPDYMGDSKGKAVEWSGHGLMR